MRDRGFWKGVFAAVGIIVALIIVSLAGYYVGSSTCQAPSPNKDLSPILERISDDIAEQNDQLDEIEKKLDKAIGSSRIGATQ